MSSNRYFWRQEARNTEIENGSSNLNVDGLNANVYKMGKQRSHIYVGRSITNANGI